MRWLVVFLGLLVVCSFVDARGYTSRACGFDMDDDGVWGEPEDCNVCDGVTLDPDGDGVIEDMLYVDCDATLNGDGSPGSPFSSFASALAAANGATGSEDIVCVAGTCNEQILLGAELNGLPTLRAKPATGSEEYDYLYPSNPGMIVGWDRDNDGQYPPYDTDDAAVFEGSTPADFKHAFLTSVGNLTHNVEVAHLTFQNYCRHANPTHAEGCGFWHQPNRNNAEPSNYTYVHDLSLRNINRGHPMGSDTIFLYQLWHRNINYHALENIECLDCAGYGLRGSTASAPDPSSHLRLKNISVRWHGCGYAGAPDECVDVAVQPSGPGATVLKMWGLFDFTEVLDSVWDVNPVAWNNLVTLASAIGPNTCVQDFVARNNEFIDFRHAVALQGGAASGCRSRFADRIIIDGNLIRDPSGYRVGDGSSKAISLQIGNGATDTWTENIDVTNNIILSNEKETCFYYAGITAANPVGAPVGTITYSGNTCVIDHPIAGGALFAVSGHTYPNVHQSFVMENNIFMKGTGTPPRRLVAMGYTPTNFQSDYNLYDPTVNGRVNYLGGGYLWGGTYYETLAEFAIASGTNQHSKGPGQNECTPSFVSGPMTDAHLSSGDTCAIDYGTDMSAYTRVDFDGDSRPQGLDWDIGADEVTGGPSCHWADTDCSGVVSIPELVTVILAWQSGSRSIPELVDAILAWQS